MKIHFNSLFSTFVAASLSLAALAPSSIAAETTALSLVREGNRYVGEEAKGRLIEIRSEKSIGSTTPTIWYVVYFDPASKGRGTEVKFAAGTKVAVKHRGNFLGMAKTPQELPKDKVRVDSDEALRKALAEPLLKNLTLKATQMTLEDWEGIVTWKVEIWAAKIQKPEEMVSVGKVFIDAAEGKVLKSDLKISKVD